MSSILSAPGNTHSLFHTSRAHNDIPDQRRYGSLVRAPLLGREPDDLAARQRACLPQLGQRMDEIVHLLVCVHRRRRQPDALGAARHGRIVDRLHVDAVLGRAACPSPLCSAPDRRPSPERCGSRWQSTGRPASERRRLSVCARSCSRARSMTLDLRWRMLASAPAAMAGASEVVKMKPAAYERMASQHRGSRRCSRP